MPITSRPAAASASAAALPIPFGARGNCDGTAYNVLAEFYADLLCGAAGSLFACIDFTRSAAEAPSSDSP